MEYSDAICLLAGPVISFVVSFLKKIPLVKRFPKSAAGFISMAVGAYTATHGSTPGIDYGTLVQCILTNFAAAVATHEAIVEPVAKVTTDGGTINSKDRRP